ncbi:MAG: 50S ribosomal protein L24 [Verrucomicrobia bacterium]|nr:50S ribosomal protein L24 [Verrucomicrobiota bacterium]
MKKPVRNRRLHVKKGDEVVVISGSSRGKRGKIIHVFMKKMRVSVEGCAMIKKHMRKSQQHPQGAIIEREGTIHASNVMLASKWDARRAKRAAAQPALAADAPAAQAAPQPTA